MHSKTRLSSKNSLQSQTSHKGLSYLMCLCLMVAEA